MDTSPSPSPVDSSEPNITGRNRSLVLVAVLASIFMVAMESSVLATAMPSIVPQLGGFHLYSWVFSASLLTQAVTTPIYGKLADLYGRKRVLLFGVSVFILAALCCGFATTMPELIAFRAIQGIGAGAVLPVALTIVGDIYPARERAQVQGYIGSMWGISGLVGPVIGAFIVEQLWWPIVFWINLPLGIMALMLIAICYRIKPPQRRVSLDILGGSLLVIGATCLLLALIQMRTLAPLTFFGLLVIAALATVAFFLQERRAKEPMLPLDLWRDRIVVIATCGSIFMGVAQIGVVTFLPAQLRGVSGYAATEVAIVMVALTIGWPTGATLAGRIVLRSSYRAVMLAGGTFIAVGSAGLILALNTTGLASVCIAACLFGAGLGLSNSMMIIALQTSVTRYRRGTATAAAQFCRFFGQSLGAALLGVMLNSVIEARVPGGTALVDVAMDGASRATIPVITLAALVDALSESLAYVYAACGTAGFVVLILAFQMPRGLRPGGSEQR